MKLAFDTEDQVLFHTLINLWLDFSLSNYNYFIPTYDSSLVLFFSVLSAIYLNIFKIMQIFRQINFPWYLAPIQPKPHIWLLNDE